MQSLKDQLSQVESKKSIAAQLFEAGHIGEAVFTRYRDQEETTEETLLMAQEVVNLRADNESLKAQHSPKVGLKVSEKGALSVYGLQRFPVTLYAPGWIELAKRMPDILRFIEENKAKLSWERTKKAS